MTSCLSRSRRASGALARRLRPSTRQITRKVTTNSLIELCGLLGYQQWLRISTHGKPSIGSSKSCVFVDCHYSTLQTRTFQSNLRFHVAVCVVGRNAAFANHFASRQTKSPLREFQKLHIDGGFVSLVRLCCEMPQLYIRFVEIIFQSSRVWFVTLLFFRDAADFMVFVTCSSWFS